MAKSYMFRLMMVVAVISMIGFGGIAMAGPGYGCYGRGPDSYSDDYGPGYRHGKGYERHQLPADLDEEQVKKLEEERRTFWEATKDLPEKTRIKK